MTVDELVSFLQTEVPDGSAQVCIQVGSGLVDVGLMRFAADATVVVVMPVFALAEETDPVLCQQYNPEDRAENYGQEQ